MENYDITLNDDVRGWIDSRIADGRYASIDAYFDALVRRDIDENDDDAVARLRAALETGRRSGVSKRNLDDILRDHLSARDAA